MPDRIDESELYRRSTATMLASWREYARGSSGARVESLGGASAGVFPEGPERAFYNNALFDLGLDAPSRQGAIEAVSRVYESNGITDYRAWVHESDAAMRADLEKRGFTLRETTKVMAMRLDEASLPSSPPAASPASWEEYLRILEVPEGLLAGADAAAFHVLVAGDPSDPAATAMAFEHQGDCGIFNVFTREAARRRGYGTAVTAGLLIEASERGCTTASLQSTPIAEHIYAQLGFRDLGRFLEYGAG